MNSKKNKLGQPGAISRNMTKFIKYLIPISPFLHNYFAQAQNVETYNFEDLVDNDYSSYSGNSFTEWSVFGKLRISNYYLRIR